MSQKAHCHSQPTLSLGFLTEAPPELALTSIMRTLKASCMTLVLIGTILRNQMCFDQCDLGICNFASNQDYITGGFHKVAAFIARLLLKTCLLANNQGEFIQIREAWLCNAIKAVYR